jgi:DNA polymerase III gamma/tau subunit
MKLLEQLSKQGKTITTEMVGALTGYTQEYAVDALIKALVQKDLSGALAYVSTRVEQGVDFALLQKRLLEALRELLLKEIAKPSQSSTTEYLRLIQHVVKYGQHQKNSPIPQLPMEMAIVSWCQGEASPANPQEVIQPTKPMSPKPQPQAASKHEQVRSEKVTAQSENAATTKATATNNAQSMNSNAQHLSPSSVSLSLTEIETKWSELLALVRLKNVSVEALLKAAKPANADGNTLTLEVLYAFHKEQLEQQRHRTMVEAMMASLFGGECRINLVLARSAAKKVSGDVVNVTGNLQDEHVAQAVEEIFG